ncbi:hypothetical protein FRX31_034634, partial [Thalictrum thalictroides]
MTTEFVLETGKTRVYSEIKSSDMGNMAGDIIVTSQGKNVKESIPVGNGVTIDGRAQLEQLKVNSDMGSFGVHSPKKVSNEGLVNMLQTTLAKTAGQEHSPINNAQQGKIPIQFGSFIATSSWAQ